MSNVEIVINKAKIETITLAYDIYR